jgi:hypothetical protein
MTPTELLASLAELGPQDFSVVLQFLADRVYESRLFDGSRIHDAVDFKLWLEQLSIAAHTRRAGLVATTKPAAKLPEQERWS